MRRLQSAKVSALGVTHTKLAVERELGWVFREQPTEDYGIDAQVEVVEGVAVSGKLLGLQIKSGMSWFRESAPGGWWYRPAAEHVRYWLNHSLPVVVVLCHPDTGHCHWQLVSQDTVVCTTAGGYKLLVPEAQVLDESARRPLREVAAGDPAAANGTNGIYGDGIRVEDPLTGKAKRRPVKPAPARVVAILVVMAVLATVVGAKFFAGHWVGSAEARKTAASPPGPSAETHSLPDSYALVLSGGEYAPLGPGHPTLLQVHAATQESQGDIQWRSVDAIDQFNSGDEDIMVQLPPGTAKPTFAACIAQTAQVPSVHAPQGSAFCIIEPGNIIAGVSVISINSSAGKADLQIMIWKYSG